MPTTVWARHKKRYTWSAVSTFAQAQAKSAYMWRDIARRAEMHGIPARLPAPYPVVASGRANLVAIIGMREGWGVDYVRAAYRRWFQHGEENGGDANLTSRKARS